jgi:hypothetical protein
MKTELELVKDGPLPGHMDLWAEHENFFHGLHEQMIGEMARELSTQLYEMGYNVGRERSLQIAEGRIPDIHIQKKNSQPSIPAAHYEYALAADEALADAGVPIEVPNLDALTIRDRKTGKLITVIEVVSPGNKREDNDIAFYQYRREQLYLLQQVNVVEIDITRSYKRLIHNEYTTTSAYHVAVFLPYKGVRIIAMPLYERFKRIAIPLQERVIASDLHAIYTRAYGDLLLASSLLDEGMYSAKTLPFSSLLTDQQRDEALEAVRVWQDELKRIRQS